MAADNVGTANGSPDQPLLAIAGVSKYFGGVRAVEDVTVTIRRGEIMSVIGPNGAGKTSLLNMISGFYRPSSGSIVLEGRDITRSRPSEIAALGVARTFQNIALFAGMTVLDNIMLGRHVRMKAGVLSSFVYWGLAQKEEVAHRAYISRPLTRAIAGAGRRATPAARRHRCARAPSRGMRTRSRERTCRRARA